MMTSSSYSVLTADTPNGVKIPIALEELGLSYEIQFINLSSGEQHSAPFRRLNPNGKIPLIRWKLDTGAMQTMVESGAILLFLAERHGGLLGETDSSRRRAMEWLFFQVSAIGPIYGNSGWFRRNDPENESAINRFFMEAQRLTSLLDGALQQQEWLNESCFSVADIAHFGWIESARYAGIDIGCYTNVERWHASIAQRPSVVKAKRRLGQAPEA